jgi:hypothetical protein
MPALANRRVPYALQMKKAASAAQVVAPKFKTERDLNEALTA